MMTFPVDKNEICTAESAEVRTALSFVGGGCGLMRI